MRLIIGILIIMYTVAGCAHPEKPGVKTDPFTAFWYSLDGPSDLPYKLKRYNVETGTNYHHRYPYYKWECERK